MTIISNEVLTNIVSEIQKFKAEEYNEAIGQFSERVQFVLKVISDPRVGQMFELSCKAFIEILPVIASHLASIAEENNGVMEKYELDKLMAEIVKDYTPEALALFNKFESLSTDELIKRKVAFERGVQQLKENIIDVEFDDPDYAVLITKLTNELKATQRTLKNIDALIESRRS